ncbi:MAG: hypothetical protein K5798_01805 [Nitrosopumilus sp.]|uniref:hypothetical protein n=1 Tax=Nitrosopumilus sp. TaxID=2024843 RepID=UPI00242D2D6D|nr:hypothetical protein [Nitrosopumilus sp.]MCV0365986.1 hypothetical protein [Nitrosopumilus sp.]
MKQTAGIGIVAGLGVLALLYLATKKIETQQKQIQIITAEKLTLGNKVTFLEGEVRKKDAEIDKLNTEIQDLKKSKK